MNGLESCIGRENRWKWEGYQRNICIYSVNKLQTVSLLWWRQSNSGKADVLSGGENDSCVSVQVSSECSDDVSWVLTVCRGLQRAFDAKLTSFNFILESKWDIRALGLERSCCIISPVSLVWVAVAKPKPPSCSCACARPVIQWLWCALRLHNLSPPAPLHHPHCPAPGWTSWYFSNTGARSSQPFPCPRSMVPSHPPLRCNQSDPFLVCFDFLCF